jgi:flavodoxin
MRSLLVCVSVSNGNTRRLAGVLAEELDGTVVEPEDVDAGTLDDYDLVGFGSGIYAMAFHRRLVGLVRRLPEGQGRSAFVYATSGSPEPPFWRYTRGLQRRLEDRGYSVRGTFSCRGYDTWLPLRLVGGLNKGHPDAADFERARTFARDLRQQIEHPPST